MSPSRPWRWLSLLPSLHLLIALALAGAGCSSAGNARPDGGTDGPTVGDVGADVAPATALKVAGVQYSSGDHSAVNGCDDDLCGVAHFVRDAASKGAVIINTPEYAQDQTKSELSPAIGDAPATDARWADGSIIQTFSKLAVELKVTLIFNLITQDGAGSSAPLYNTSLAVGPAGKVLARHYKFQLFGSETGKYTPGPSVADSFFQTPSGLAGLMICADAQCIVTKLSTSPDCTAHAVALLKDYFAEKPAVVFFSSFWTVGGTGIWAALNVQKQVAVDGKVWVVAANNTAGEGKGGAIYDPTGKEMTKHFSAQPGVIYGEIPFAP